MPRDVDEIRDVVMLESEVRLAEKMVNIIGMSGYEIVHTDNVVTFSDKSLTKMAT
jgi:hypothetical protein